MGFENLFHYLNQTLEVLFVNLLLSGDNAVVIALACRSLPPKLTRRAMWIGIDGAIALRILLATVASFLLSIPLLKLAGGVALTVIAIKLTVERHGGTDSEKSPRKNSPGLWSAVGTIIVADLVMSVDNVLALAAVAQGSIFILSMGLLMSVPLLLFGSLLVSASAEAISAAETRRWCNARLACRRNCRFRSADLGLGQPAIAGVDGSRAGPGRPLRTDGEQDNGGRAGNCLCAAAKAQRPKRARLSSPRLLQSGKLRPRPPLT